MKKLLFSIAFLCAISSNAQTLKYDLNGDGKEDIADVAFCIDYLNQDQKDYKGVCNGHEYVDLGLSVKWATMNIGATEVVGSKYNNHTGKLDCYGNYYAWGETSPKKYYDWDTYKWMVPGKSSEYYCTKYTIEDWQYGGCWYSDETYIGTTVNGVTYKNYNTLELTDDAANANWGGSWRMPTEAEFIELRDNCYWEWTTNYNKSNDPNNVVYVPGYIIYKVKNVSDKGKKNNHDITSQTPTATYSVKDPHIFLPTAGNIVESTFYDEDSYGHYLSSQLDIESALQCILYFSSQGVYISGSYRREGITVRAVCP